MYVHKYILCTYVDVDVYRDICIQNTYIHMYIIYIHIYNIYMRINKIYRNILKCVYILNILKTAHVLITFEFKSCKSYF